MKNLPLKRFGVNIRRYILASLEKNLSYEKAALIEAMLIGYRENFTESMENAFSASGLTYNGSFGSKPCLPDISAAMAVEHRRH